MPNSRFLAELMRRSARAYATAAVAQLAQQHPALAAASLPSAFAGPIGDQEARILQFAESVAVDAPELTVDVVGWYRVAFAHRGVPDDYLPCSLRALANVLATELPANGRDLVLRHLQAAELAAQTGPRDLDSLLDGDAPFVDEARRFLLAVLEDRPDDAIALVRGSLDAGVSVAAVHDHVLTVVQREVGRMWMMGEVPIADEHQCSLIVGRVLDLLQDRIARPGPSAPRVLAFAAGGNLHDLGIRLVAQRLQLAGMHVTNLGANLPSSDLEFVLCDRRFDLLAVSVTMLLHLGEAAALVARRKAFGSTRILVGGRPFALVPDLHARIGADAGAGDAAAAVVAAQRLLRD